MVIILAKMALSILHFSINKVIRSNSQNEIYDKMYLKK